MTAVRRAGDDEARDADAPVARVPIARDAGTPAGPAPVARVPIAPVVVLADDLIWATRLEAFVRAAGRSALSVRDLPGLSRALGTGAAEVVVDLTARSYDGVAAVRAAVGAGAEVAVVCQHDDREAREAARAAGATLVQPYARMHADGAAIVARWLSPERRR